MENVVTSREAYGDDFYKSPGNTNIVLGVALSNLPTKSLFGTETTTTVSLDFLSVGISLQSHICVQCCNAAIVSIKSNIDQVPTFTDEADTLMMRAIGTRCTADGTQDVGEEGGGGEGNAEHKGDDVVDGTWDTVLAEALQVDVTTALLQFGRFKINIVYEKLKAETNKRTGQLLMPKKERDRPTDFVRKSVLPWVKGLCDVSFKIKAGGLSNRKESYNYIDGWLLYHGPCCNELPGIYFMYSHVLLHYFF